MTGMDAASTMSNRLSAPFNATQVRLGAEALVEALLFIPPRVGSTSANTGTIAPATAPLARLTTNSATFPGSSFAGFTPTSIILVIAGCGAQASHQLATTGRSTPPTGP